MHNNVHFAFLTVKCVCVKNNKKKKKAKGIKKIDLLFSINEINYVHIP